MTSDQKQIILGSLLGNGFICNKKTVPYFCIQHSKNHFHYLKRKTFHLKEFERKTPFYEKNNICGWRSKSSTIWNEFLLKCYKNDKKEISMEWLDELRDIGLAVWYMDSGFLCGNKNKNACLRTQVFGLEGNKIIEKYFNQVGMPCSINKSKKSYVVLLKVESTITLFKLIAKYFQKN